MVYGSSLVMTLDPAVTKPVGILLSLMMMLKPVISPLAFTGSVQDTLRDVSFTTFSMGLAKPSGAEITEIFHVKHRLSINLTRNYYSACLKVHQWENLFYLLAVDIMTNKVLNYSECNVSHSTCILCKYPYFSYSELQTGIS